MPTVFHCIPNMAGGGAERQLCLLAEGMCKGGVEVHVACAPSGAYYPLLQKTGVAVHVLHANSSYDPGLLLQLVRHIRAVKPDLVQTWLPQMDVLGGVAARLTGIPFLLSERSSARAYPASIRRVMRNVVAHLASAVVANSNAGRDYWRPRLRCPIHVIRNGVSPGTAPAQGNGREASTILFLGRFHPDKCAVETALGTAEALRRHPSARALFQGHGPQEGRLRQIAGAADLENRMTIAPFGHDVGEAMAQAAIFVSVSRYEGHPNAVIEAAMAGIPLVLSDIPAHREMFGNDECRYVADWSPVAISEAILAILRDPSGAARRAANARSMVSAFSVEAMVDAYTNLYASLVGVRSR